MYLTCKLPINLFEINIRLLWSKSFPNYYSMQNAYKLKILILLYVKDAVADENYKEELFLFDNSQAQAGIRPTWNQIPEEKR